MSHIDFYCSAAIVLTKGRVIYASPPHPLLLLSSLSHRNAKQSVHHSVKTRPVKKTSVLLRVLEEDEKEKEKRKRGKGEHPVNWVFVDVDVVVCC